MAAADLDYGPLARRTGLHAALRGLAANPLLLIGTTVALLLSVLAAALGVGLLVGDDDPDVALVAVSLFFAAAGACAVAGGVGRARDGASLEAFATANGLTSLHGSPADDYAGLAFAGGALVVHVGVRTPGAAFCEVGDCHDVSRVRGDEDHRAPTLYLRVRTVGFLRPDQDAATLLGDALLEDLTAAAGPTTVELAPREVTVIGSRPLGPPTPRRVREVLGLAERVAARAEAVARPPRRRRGGRGGPEGDTPSGVPVPAPPSASVPGPRLRPVTIVLATVVVVLGLPLGLAVLMSALEPRTVTDPWVGAVVAVALIGGICVVVTALVRLAVTHRGREGRGSR